MQVCCVGGPDIMSSITVRGMVFWDGEQLMESFQSSQIGPSLNLQLLL